MAWLTTALIIAAVLSLVVLAAAAPGIVNGWRRLAPELDREATAVGGIRGRWGRYGRIALATVLFGVVLVSAGTLVFAAGAPRAVATVLIAAGLLVVAAANLVWQTARKRARRGHAGE